MIKLVIMRIRKIPPRLITDGIIILHRAGLDFVTSEELETHFLASGNVANVVDALIAAAHSVQVWLDGSQQPTSLPPPVREGLTASLCTDLPKMPSRD